MRRRVSRARLRRNQFIILLIAGPLLTAEFPIGNGHGFRQQMMKDHPAMHIEAEAMATTDDAKLPLQVTMFQDQANGSKSSRM